jgi:hypothetical protein
VGAGVAALCLTPAVIAAWPAPTVRADPDALHQLILGSTSRPYQGYVDSVGQIRLPDLPALGDVAALFSSSTRLRTWYATPRSWRVTVLDPTGERDIYRTADGTYRWDFERNLFTFTPGELPVRPPWAADLPPPELARRLLGGAATGSPRWPVGASRAWPPLGCA